MTSPDGAAHWRLRDARLSLARPCILGVLNVTPDSFSDGGLDADVDDAVARALAMRADGADVIDVGGESTRPGATPMDASTELARVVPVIAALVRHAPGIVISVDTVKGAVAEAALDAGATIVNDVSGLRLDARMAALCAAARCGVVLMHSRGEVHDMASFAHAAYDGDVVDAVARELGERMDAALAAGIDRDAIVLDPGIGFAKRSADSLRLIARLPRLAAALGRPLLVGASRKRFVGEITGVGDTALRVHGSVGAHVAALARGARLFRVHDVRAHREALDVAWAALGAGVAGEVTP